MRIYIDLCVYNRTFDDQSQPRIMLESMCFIVIMSRVPSGDIKTINSFALEYENSKNPKIENRMIIEDMLNISSEYIAYSEKIQKSAEQFENEGIMGMDALHLACAEMAKAEYFITCDDALLKRAEKIENMQIKTISVMEYVHKEVL
jgi:predicted nucleic acid-binding protein